MPTVKFQLYLEQESADYLNALCERYGWSATQCVDRLVRFYNEMRMQAEGLSILNSEDGDNSALAYSENGEVFLCDEVQIAYRFARVAIDGLTPLHGFAHHLSGEEEE